MRIISFFESDSREHWLAEIKKCDWRAGTYLYELLTGGTFFELVGEGSRLLLLTDGDRLISFCTLAERDEIDGSGLTPWIGFVYTFPEYRGHRYFGLLLDEALGLAKEAGISKVYISTDHIGLYEKYGFEFIAEMKSIYGDVSRVYARQIK